MSFHNIFLFKSSRVTINAGELFYSSNVKWGVMRKLVLVILPKQSRVNTCGQTNGIATKIVQKRSLLVPED